MKFFDVQVFDAAFGGARNIIDGHGKGSIGSSSYTEPLGLAPMKIAKAIWHPFL
jgi:hypothetical protein